MAVAGSIDLWADYFPNDQLSKIIQLVLDSWSSFILPANRLEVPLTRHFCVHLRNNKDRSIHIFRIDWESSELTSEGLESGRIDLKFSQGLDERVYFSLECKRLRIQSPSGFQTLAGKYVTEGMYRYFNSQYAVGLDKAGMLGYVMDGNVTQAVQDVTKAIESRKTALCMSDNDTLVPSPLVSSPQVKQTFHNYGSENRFTVYHIFLPLC